MSSTFATEYKKLNAAQKEAVDALEGPVMVIAGPGTGKTHVLTLRIANILTKTDTPPDGILALTFTEAGVDAMKRRLLSIIGPTAYKVGIHTFHGFCNEIIHAHPEHFPRIVSSTALTDIESIIMMREAITTLSLEKLKPFGDPYFYVPTIRSAIATLKREHKRPEDVIATTERRMRDIEGSEDSLHQKGAHKGKMKGDVQKMLEKLKKERELAQVFEWYEQKLEEKRRFDFEDMIGEVVRALEHDEDFKLLVQEKYLYILADEHQDANGTQNKLLELLTDYDTSPNLFIVGDEKQAIFRFQGASLESFAYFHQKFPRALLIPLTESYRSGSILLDAAHSLMCESISPERHPGLVSRIASPEHSVLESRVFSSEENEIAWVVSDVKRKIEEGHAPGELAIIYRTNADAARIARSLAQAGILHTLDSKSSVLKDHSIAQLLTYLRLVTHIGNDEFLAYVLQFPWTQLDMRDAYKIMLLAQKKRISYLEMLSSAEMLREARATAPEKAQELAQVLMRLSQLAQEESARDFFDRVLHESGYLTYVLTRHDAVSILNSLRGLARTLEGLSAGKTLYTGRDFVHDLGLYEEYGIEIESDVLPKERGNAVHLVTAHRSKGLEYEDVYIVHARDGHWGNRARRDLLSLATLASTAESDIEDERRLFYVALTRAKHFVSVSYGVTASGRTRESTVTQFMLEMNPALIREEPTDAFESSLEAHAVFALRPHETSSLSDHDFLRDAFLEQGISATALNNYLECPWKYFYRNLIRIPEKPTASSLYGNALHNALRLFRDLCASTQTYESLEKLLEYLKISIDAQGFTPASYEDAHTKGTRALTDWHAKNAAQYEYNVMCERKFEVYMPLQGDLSTVLLRGMIDVIQFNSTGSISVIDYKTGKHRSRNELEGKTKNANGDYKRQLDFYCILLELSKMDSPQDLVLEFIEPDEKGKTASHSFTYDAQAVAELKETIERVSSEIYSLSFWEARCSNAQCEFCALRYEILPRSS